MDPGLCEGDKIMIILLLNLSNHILSQLDPFPSNGELHVHVKFSVITLSLTQAALTSHGLDEHGSGTVV